MKAYIEYLVPSATNPNEHVSRLGSDGVQILDGRLNLGNMVNEALRSSNKKIFKPSGFKIIRANRFSEEGKVLHTHIFKTYNS